MSIRVGAKAAIIREGCILLVEYDDETGLHYNFPGGGVETGESLREAIIREVKEETCADVSVDTPIIMWEYVPSRYNNKYGTQHQISFLFRCRLKEGSIPAMPDQPDANQTGVRWIPLSDVGRVKLIPDLGSTLITALQGENTGNLVFCDEWE